MYVVCIYLNCFIVEEIVTSPDVYYTHKLVVSHCGVDSLVFTVTEDMWNWYTLIAGALQYKYKNLKDYYYFFIIIITKS